MGSYYAEHPINPSPEPWSFPPPDYFSASQNEFRSPFVSSFSPDTWYGDPPINTSKLTYFPPPEPDYFSMSPEDTWYPDPPFFKVALYFSTSYDWLSVPKPDLPFRTLGEGLHELYNNSSSGAPKANDDSSALANVEGSWVNISNTQPAFTWWTLGTGLHDEPADDTGIIGEPANDGRLNKPFGDSNGKVTTVESMGTADGADNWNSKETCSESKTAFNTSGEKETGGVGGAGKYHTCEELSCGNACYTCGEVDHFTRKCTLGADCGCSGHHSGGNSTIPYVV